MKNTRQGQSALEFLVLAGFMLFIFTAFFFVITQRNAAANQQGRYGEMVVIADVINQEVTNAYRVQDGYIRVFEIPSTINGDQYNITLYYTSGAGASEMLIQTANEQYLLFLPANITVFDTSGAQALLMNPGRYAIKKLQGNISVQSLLVEQDTCSFTSSAGTAVNCFASSGDSCTTVGGATICNIPVTGVKGQIITWSSSCVQNTQTTPFDGVDKTINFACLPVSEQFTCKFTGTSLSQTCKSSKGGSCTSSGSPQSCIVQTNGVFGEAVTWNSSCAGTAAVLLDTDSTNNILTFACNQPIQEQNTCVFLENPSKGGTHMCFVQNNPLINCTANSPVGSANNECTVNVNQLPGTGMEWSSDNCIGGASTAITNENKRIPFFCNTP